MKRIFLIVLDSFGIGGAKDAAAFGDEGADTLGSLMKTENFSLDAMKKLGLLNIDGVSREGYPKYEAPVGALKNSPQARTRQSVTGKLPAFIRRTRFPSFRTDFRRKLLMNFPA